MRRFIGALVIVVMGSPLGWTTLAAEAADSCSLNGTYAIDGLADAGGLLSVVGTLTFDPGPTCTGGTVGGTITIKSQGQPPASFTPAGTYSVTSTGAVTITLPDVIDLVGVLSLEGVSGRAHSLHLAASTTPLVFSMAGTAKTLTVGPQDLTCSPDAVRSGSTCIDKYEASVWEIPSGSTAVIAKIKNGTVTLAELTAAGFQRGVSSDNYGAGCPDTGNGCVNFYAVSIPGVTPSAFLTWFQAAAAARNAGKRLPSNAEWQAAALGTPDGAPCIVSTGGPGLTGTAGCVSDVGAFDMVGSLWEWVADWTPLSTTCVTSLFGTGDGNCLAGASTTAGPGALVRGGFFDVGTFAGVFAVGGFTPSSAGSNIGFRAAR